MKLSIIIVCHNQAKWIPIILERFGVAICRNDIELVVVDNASTDNSRAVLERQLPSYLFVQALYLEKKLSRAHAIQKAVAVAAGKYICWTDADLTADPKDCIRALEVVETQGNPDDIYVKGIRYGRTVSENFREWGKSLFETLYFRKWMWDAEGQPNLCHRWFCRSWQDIPDDVPLELYALYMAKMERDLQIMRLPVFPQTKKENIIASNDNRPTGKVGRLRRTLRRSAAVKRALKKG